MNEEEYNAQCDKEYKEAETLFSCIEHAMKSNMHIEFIMSFLDDFMKTQDVIRSIEYANKEWDL